MYDPTTWDWHQPGTWFVAVYAAARVLSHFIPPTNRVGGFLVWVLGQVKVPPNPDTKKDSRQTEMFPEKNP